MISKSALLNFSILFLLFSIAARAQTGQALEMILEFHSRSDHDLKEAALEILKFPGAHIAGISTSLQIILVKIDVQAATSREAILASLRNKNLPATEKYGTVDQVLSELGASFCSLDNFQIRER